MRLAFRILLALTLITLILGRVSGGKMLPTPLLAPFIAWFSVSVFVFGIFGLRAAYLAWRDPANRRAYMFDIILAVAWIPYWYVNLKRSGGELACSPDPADSAQSAPSSQSDATHRNHAPCRRGNIRGTRSESAPVRIFGENILLRPARATRPAHPA